MILESPYKEGSLVTFYRDPENELIPMGTARLRELRSTGLPIILKESSNEYTQEYYVIEEWLIEWDQVDYKLVTTIPWLYREDKPHKIRRLYRIGL